MFLGFFGKCIDKKCPPPHWPFPQSTLKYTSTLERSHVSIKYQKVLFPYHRPNFILSFFFLNGTAVKKKIFCGFPKATQTLSIIYKLCLSRVVWHKFGHPVKISTRDLHFEWVKVFVVVWFRYFFNFRLKKDSSTRMMRLILRSG